MPRAVTSAECVTARELDELAIIVAVLGHTEMGEPTRALAVVRDVLLRQPLEGPTIESGLFLDGLARVEIKRSAGANAVLAPVRALAQRRRLRDWPKRES